MQNDSSDQLLKYRHKTYHDALSVRRISGHVTDF